MIKHVLLTLSVFACTLCMAQSPFYTNFNLTIGYNLHPKAQSNLSYGQQYLIHEQSGNHTVGLTYDFLHFNNLEIESGIMMSMYPSLKSYTVYNEVSQTNPTGRNREFAYYNDPIPYMSIPVRLKYNIDMTEHLSLNFIGGYHLNLHQKKHNEVNRCYQDKARISEIQSFQINMKNPTSLPLHSSGLIGMGVTLKTEKVNFTVNAVYNHQFNLLYEGEYSFVNESNEPYAYGDYELTANYFGLWVSMSLNELSKVY